jgi:phospho-N-acetylmuramoyl-pentapeptide-transferase
MLYYLFDWIHKSFSTPGFGIFQYLTFRAAAAAISALLLSYIFAPKIIKFLKKKQIGEQAKQELQKVGNHSLKAGTPTMGGLIVLFSLIIPTILWANIGNIYIILILITTIWLGGVGFLDDYLKVIKKMPNGLMGRYKLVGQLSIGLIIGCVIYFFPQLFSDTYYLIHTVTTIPFLKEASFNFGYFYIPIVMFVVTATSNAVNLTDGLDGLSIGTVGIATLALAIMAYLSGNVQYAQYLNIGFPSNGTEIYLKGSGELVIFCAALVGSALGFLWFNSYPAQVFMGDTGSLALGGAIGVISILIKKEFLLPVLGGVFFAETLSVIIQVNYFKYTKKKYGEGKRIFKMAPLHHHFEKSGIHESKIVARFYIIAVLLAILTLSTFKLR